MSPLYIISSSCISPQPSFQCHDLNMEINETSTNIFHCIEPNFSLFINPVQIRRMSLALKIGYATAIDCLKQEENLIPDAVMIGTGKGCLEDTELFLHSMRTYHETALNATHFIHSTYNQLNGMIALNRKISSYNMTYVHRGFSFEHALIDAGLLFDENQAQSALVGSFDEMTEEHFTIKKQWGYWKDELINSKDLLLSESKGTIAGQGSAFYLVSKIKPQHKVVSIQSVVPLYRPSETDIQFALNHMLSKLDLKIDDIDLVLLGENGDANYKQAYQNFKSLFSNTQFLYFKHLCGEYDTATSFGTWLASQILLNQAIPNYVLHPKEEGQLEAKFEPFQAVYKKLTGKDVVFAFPTVEA